MGDGARYVLVWGEEASAHVRQSVEDLLERHGLNVEWSESSGGHLATVHAGFDALAAEAEQLLLEKPLLKDSSHMAPFRVEKLHIFQGCDNTENFFTPAEESRLLWSVLQTVPFKKDDFLKSGLDVDDKMPFVTALLHCKDSHLEDAFPLHAGSAWRKFLKSVGLNIFKLEQPVRDYFGEEVAVYFVWMNFFTIWLLIPAILGLVLYFLRPEGVTVDNSPYLPFYALAVPLWGVFYLKFWRRHMSAIAFGWNTHDYNKMEELRPDFWGEQRISPITGKQEVFFPQRRRYLRYFVSFLAMQPMLLVAVGAMLLSLNLNGYIKDVDSPVHFAALAKFAEPGGLFAADSPYYGWLVPTLMHSVVIAILNKIYRSIAIWSTDLENHRTEEDWQQSLVIKRVIFEAFDCYLALFYIAFYRLDVVALRAELIGLFSGDEIRRISTEVILPLVTEQWQQRSKRREAAASKKKTGEKPVVPSQAVLDSCMEEYESFDDFLEMVIQFGYITLFASAFPLTSAISVVFVVIETYSDSFKLFFVHRRPRARRSRGIGVWYTVMYVMVVMSILTNCLIFGFSSEQLLQWLPTLFEHVEGDQQLKMGFGRYVVGIVFVVEHILIIIALGIEFFVPSRPDWVETAIARQDYLAQQWLAKTQAEQALSKTE